MGVGLHSRANIAAVNSQGNHRQRSLYGALLIGSLEVDNSICKEKLFSLSVMYVWPFTSVLDDQARLLQLASVCGGICGLVFVILGLVISLEIFIVLLVYQMITYPGEVSTALLFLICVLGAALVTVLACLFASLFIYFLRRKLYSQRRVAERRRRSPGACATIYEGKFDDGAAALGMMDACMRSDTVTCAMH